MPTRVGRAMVVVSCVWVCLAAKPRSNKDWAKMSDKDWEEVEKEWETPEERKEYEYKPPTKKPLDMDAFTKPGANVEHLVADSKVDSGPTMMFAKLRCPIDGECDKDETSKISSKWSAMLSSGGLATMQVYPIEKDMVLFSFPNGMFAHEIRDYVIEQQECFSITWNDVTYDGKHVTEEDKARE